MKRVARVLAWFVLPVAFAAAIAAGETRTFSAAEVLRGVGAMLGLDRGIDGAAQAILELRLWRAVVAAAVGAALALAGAMLQGLFRNPLASPSVLGVTSGASLGATVAVAVVGGWGPTLFVRAAQVLPMIVVPAAAFAGAAAVTVIVWLFGLRSRSVTTLLLAGIAVATLCGGVQQSIQSYMLRDQEVSVAIVAWSFGTLDDRSQWHALTVVAGLAVGLASLPWLHRELDLFALGEGDAQALGVDPRRLKVLVVLVSSGLAAVAVSVAGQIGFIGLIVPNIVRLLFGLKHARLLAASAVIGAAFLLGVDLLHRTLLVAWNLRPGVLTSVVGAPFFLFLLLRGRSSRSSWGASWW